MKRFFRAVSVGPNENGYGVFLDGRPIKTPGKKALSVPRMWAEVLAAEWDAQDADIDPTQMVLTKCANTALDHVAGDEAMVAGGLMTNFSDLLCYRAPAPDELVARQSAGWDPMLDWAETRFGAHLKTGVGAAFIEQPQGALAAIAGHLASFDALTLTAFSGVMVILGSCVLALALREGRLNVGEAFTLSRIDDTFQNERWGIDAEAEARTNAVFAELQTLAQVLTLETETNQS